MTSNDFSPNISRDRKLPVSEFLKLARTVPVVDVRSPSEFRSGHIPGGINIPLFDDSERAIVGTAYKKEGRTEAVLKGLELASGSMTQKLRQALSVAFNGRLLVHCWRGGMRSEAMAWLFSLGDIRSGVLDGGYKSFRHYILEELGHKRNYLILGGLTGSGKTEILKHLASQGSQIADLEGIACHKGSAFGSIGQPLQPTSEHFANLLWDHLKNLDPDRTTWLEDESKNIGSVFMPDNFFDNMRQSPVIALLMDVETRMPRLLREYSNYSKEELIASLKKITRRLGGDNTRAAVESIESGDFKKAIRITLDYYDRAYLYGLRQRQDRRIIFVETDTDDVEINAGRILDAGSGFIYSRMGSI